MKSKMPQLFLSLMLALPASAQPGYASISDRNDAPQNRSSFLSAAMPSVPAPRNIPIVEEIFLRDSPLKGNLIQAQAEANRLIKINGRLTAPESRRCYAPSLPASEWSFLASKNSIGHLIFYSALGRHLGLNETYDPGISYHFTVFAAKTDGPSLYKTLEAAFADQPGLFKVVMDTFVRHGLKGINERAAFWPPELGEFKRHDLINAWTSGDENIRTAISSLIEPRAEWKLAILKDEINACKATPQEKGAAAQRVRHYYDSSVPRTPSH
jgi:hypothetical protein